MNPKKTRKKITRGDVMQIDLGDGTFAFAQVLEPPLIAFFDLRSATALPAGEIVQNKLAFSVWVMKYALTDGRWPTLGNTDVPSDIEESPAFFKRDRLSGKVSITYTGAEETPATVEEIAGLECAAVWDPEHIVERLNDHFRGKKNRWVEQMRPD